VKERRKEDKFHKLVSKRRARRVDGCNLLILKAIMVKQCGGAKDFCRYSIFFCRFRWGVF